MQINMKILIQTQILIKIWIKIQKQKPNNWSWVYLRINSTYTILNMSFNLDKKRRRNGLKVLKKNRVKIQMIDYFKYIVM